MKNRTSKWQGCVEVTIPFHDLDPLEICWHGHYVRYFELARSDLLHRIGYDYPAMRASGYAWPVIELFIRYAQPLTYRQRIRVEAHLVEWENRLKIDYRILDAESGKRLTRGHTVQVAVDMRHHRMLLECPPILREKLEAHMP
ncbi:MAG: acyl-CoA thioesterase [Zoogloeaceae bacterium]|jgi:acyl-CoA thioester hydrolase|nr:acyl-CoA thioesterase [Zoogloeaceae bacterium]